MVEFGIIVGITGIDLEHVITALGYIGELVVEHVELVVVEEK